MKRTALVLATVGALGLSVVAAPTPAQAWRGGWGWGPGLAGGLLAGAVIGGIASWAYAYGPGCGYYGYPGNYGGYAPADYGGYGYDDPYPWGGYTTTYYSTGYALAYYYRYRRVVRPAYAYYGGPYPRRHIYRYRNW